MTRIHGLCPECGLSRDLAEYHDKMLADLEGCETDYTNMRKDNDRLRAESAELRRVLEDCTNDLACQIEHHYRDTLDYPSQKRKYDLDMAPVHEARAILSRTSEQNQGEGG